MQVPLDPAELLNHGIELFRLGRYDEALAAYGRLLAVDPDHLDALNNRGATLGALRRDREALESFNRALEIRPDFAEASHNRATALRSLQQFDDALASYDRALTFKPDYVDALEGRAGVLVILGRREEALASFARALALRPNSAATLDNRACVLIEQRRYQEAMADLDRALVLMPDFVEALDNRSRLLLELTRYDEALADLGRMVALGPGVAETWRDRGDCLKALNRRREALADYGQALLLNPDMAEAWNSRGSLFGEMRRYVEALADFEHALRLRPDFAEALNNRGNMLRAAARHQEALADFESAIAIKPDLAEAWNNRGGLFQDLMLDDQALANYEQAVRLKPEFAEAHANEGMLRLRRGEFAAGWKKYEWRWLNKGWSRRREIQQPLWHGTEELRSKSILLHAEQGLGDAIQFVRYASLVADRGAIVFLEVPEVLASLLSCVAGVSRVLVRGSSLPPTDFHCSLLSLPMVFKAELATIPAGKAYLTAPRERIERWTKRIPMRPGMRVGLVWAGTPTHQNDHNRSMPFDQIAPLLSIPGVQFVCLQKEIRTEDAASLKEMDVVNVAGELADYADTAAIISLLDLVISVDTSVAHLAGAMGRPVWILLPFSADWRWLLNRNDSPWYPSARLFRQPGTGDWESVIRNIKDGLVQSIRSAKAQSG